MLQRTRSLVLEADKAKPHTAAHRDYGGVFPRLFEGRDKCPVPGRKEAPEELF